MYTSYAPMSTLVPMLRPLRARSYGTGSTLFAFQFRSPTSDGKVAFSAVSLHGEVDCKA